MDYIRTLFIGGPNDGKVESVLDVPTCKAAAPDRTIHEYERRRIRYGDEIIPVFVLKGMGDEQAFARFREIARGSNP